MPLWSYTKLMTQCKREDNKVSVAKVYVNAIKDGDIQITDVPATLKSGVKRQLELLGCGHLAPEAA